MPDELQLGRMIARLDARRLELDALLRLAVQQQRFGTDEDARLQAAAEEKRLLVEMDHLMTRIRAVEGQLLLQRKGLNRWS